MIVLIDTHTHLSHYPLNQNPPEHLKQAKKVGVEKLISVGTSIADSQQALKLAQEHPSIFCAVGIHPTEACRTNESQYQLLNSLAEKNKVIAIGETGLDYSTQCSKQNYPVKQKELFRRQLGLAVDLNLPVIIHSRNAHEDILTELQRYKGTKLKGVIHCFSGDWQLAQSYLKIGIIISFTAIVTYNNTEALLDVVERIPDDSYMLETDCPFLPPAPERKLPNTPANLIKIAGKIAQLRKQEIGTVAKNTTMTAQKLFSL